MNDDGASLRQRMTQIARPFQFFECVQCAQAIQDFLIAEGRSGKRIKLYTGSSKGKYGNIYHDRLKRNIATNGGHEGVVIRIAGEEFIFDNIYPEGISRSKWLAGFYCLALDLGGGFEITEIEF
jgi:Papain fold toxin 2